MFAVGTTGHMCQAIKLANMFNVKCIMVSLKQFKGTILTVQVINTSNLYTTRIYRLKKIILLFFPFFKKLFIKRSVLLLCGGFSISTVKCVTYLYDLSEVIHKKLI